MSRRLRTNGALLDVQDVVCRIAPELYRASHYSDEGLRSLAFEALSELSNAGILPTATDVVDVAGPKAADLRAALPPDPQRAQGRAGSKVRRSRRHSEMDAIGESDGEEFIMGEARMHSKMRASRQHSRTPSKRQQSKMSATFPGAGAGGFGLGNRDARVDGDASGGVTDTGVPKPPRGSGVHLPRPVLSSYEEVDGEELEKIKLVMFDRFSFCTCHGDCAQRVKQRSPQGGTWTDFKNIAKHHVEFEEAEESDEEEEERRRELAKS